MCKLSALTKLELNCCWRLERLPKGMKHMKSLTDLAIIMTDIPRGEQIEIIKSIDSLVRINYKPAADYYRAVGAETNN